MSSLDYDSTSGKVLGTAHKISHHGHIFLNSQSSNNTRRHHNGNHIHKLEIEMLPEKD